MKSDPNPPHEFSPDYLALLACPKCKGRLDHNTVTNSLDCASCRLRYRISAGIPVLLQEEAEPL
ncbi:MAG: Trm112 family protein [Candidatus Zixiibacteriota bacterium]